MKKKLNNLEKGARRKASVSAGAYDGRFRNKTFTDRKKEEDKGRCRETIDQGGDDMADDFETLKRIMKHLLQDLIDKSGGNEEDVSDEDISNMLTTSFKVGLMLSAGMEEETIMKALKKK
jgi:hypothetical protein